MLEAQSIVVPVFAGCRLDILRASDVTRQEGCSEATKEAEAQEAQ